MADIFLSYNEKDREVVRSLARTLEEVGWSVWWDRRLPAGMTWRRLLEQELQAMRCMLVLWSANSVKSDWVCEEATEGRLLDRLIPVRIEEVRPPAGFRELQAANLVNWDGSRNFLGMRELISDIEHKIGPPVPKSTETPARPTLSMGMRRPWVQSMGVAAFTLFLFGMGIAFYKLYFSMPQPIEILREAVPSSAPLAAQAPSVQPSQPAKPVATVVESHKPTPIAKALASAHPRCTALRERQGLGETLSSEALLFYQKEC